MTNETIQLPGSLPDEPTSERPQTRSQTADPSSSSPMTSVFPIPDRLRSCVDPSTWGNINDFDPATATPKQFASYLLYMFMTWGDEGYCGRSLHEAASDAFEGWTDNHFIDCGKPLTDEFRRMLLANGVFVVRDGQKVGANIRQALTNPFRLWTAKEVEENGDRYTHFRKLIKNDKDFLAEITRNRTIEDLEIEAIEEERKAVEAAERQAAIDAANRAAGRNSQTGRGQTHTPRIQPVNRPTSHPATPRSQHVIDLTQPAVPPAPNDVLNGMPNAVSNGMPNQSPRRQQQQQSSSRRFTPNTTNGNPIQPPFNYNTTNGNGNGANGNPFNFGMPSPNPPNGNLPNGMMPPPPIPTNGAMYPPYQMNGMMPPNRLPLAGAKQLTDLQKLYTDDTKYSGDALDTLDTKLLIFVDRCRKVGIQRDEYASGFDVMLKGRAQEYYYDRLCNQGYDYDELVRRMRDQFETEQRRQLYLSEWRTITLRSVINANPGRSKTESLEWLVDRLVKLQRVLPYNYRSDETLRDQLINCCRDIPECGMSVFKPSSTFEAVRNDLHLAISMSNPSVQEAYHQDQDDEYQQENDYDNYLTDRTYRGNGRNQRYDKQRRGYNNRGYDNKNSSNGKPNGNRSRSRQRTKKCYVCGKVGCWSTKHTDDERKAAYRRYKESSYVTDDSTEGYNQFLVWHEGVPEEPSDDAILQYHQDLANRQNDCNVQFLMEHGPRLATILTDRSIRHGLTKEDPYNQQPDDSIQSDENDCFLTNSRYNDMTFHGIIPDTGASSVSTGGHAQFKALQRLMPSVELTSSESTVRFGSGPSVSALGSANVKTPIGNIEFHVVPTDTPFLLCLQDMDRMGIRYDNLKNELQRGDVTVPIVRKWGHPWMLLDDDESVACFLTETELRRIHKRFGHPSVARLRRVLERAGHDDVDEKVLSGIEKVCKHCQLHAGRPQRFKFKLQDDRQFNYEIVVDIMYIDGKPVLHVVDSATAFCAARFLTDVSARTVWFTLRMCWIDVYQGPPDWIVTDAGTSFQAIEFHQEARMMATSVKEVPIEAHNSIGKVERYHGPVKRAYCIIRAEDPSVKPEVALQMAVKAVNDTAGPDGLVPTLLVFGAYPRIADDCAPSPSMIKRAAAIRKATDEVRKCKARRMVNEALATRNGPNTTQTLDLPLQSDVRVWREVTKSWQGPFKLLSIEDEKCIVQMPQGPRAFRSTVVKPFYTDKPIDDKSNDTPDPATENETSVDSDDENEPAARQDEPTTARQDDEPLDTIVVDVPQEQQHRRTRRRNEPATFMLEVDDPIDDSDSDDFSFDSESDGLCYITEEIDIFLSTKEKADLDLAISLRKEGKIRAPGKPFEESDRKEINALMDRDVFEIVPFDPSQHAGIRVFNSRMVNEVKGKGTDTPYEKSRLVIQGYADDEKQTILTQAPTIQRASQRLILSIAPSLLRRDEMCLWLRDITQAYVQSATELNRTIIARLPRQIQHLHPSNAVMIIKKPLYGIAEAGTHWWNTYNKHHRKNLQMESSTYDPCLLITTSENDAFGVIGMQTDDTIGLSDDTFDRREEEQLVDAQFAAKPKQYLTNDDPIIFNGGIVRLDATNGTIQLRQKEQGKKLQLIDVDDPNARQRYVEQRARGAYIASICQPEACFDLSTAAQHQNPEKGQFKLLNRRIKWQMDNLDRGLNFIPLDLKTVKLFVFVDGSFANNADLTSQLGFIVILANERDADDESSFRLTGNIIHFSSTKCKRVTRSVLASEVYGMVAGVDIAYTISTTLRQITDKLSLPSIPTVVCTDSYSLYECLVKLGTTKEKRLMIDIMALRQSYERRELTEIRWINGQDNLADCFTKSEPNPSLSRFVDDNETTVRKEGWVARN